MLILRFFASMKELSSQVKALDEDLKSVEQEQMIFC